MKIIQAKFIINTPMFLHGGEGSHDLSIRPPSIKGALRFWWRALRWPVISDGLKHNAALSKLHKEESALFGLAADSSKPEVGQGLVRLKVLTPNLTTEGTWKPNQSGAGYLLGQGVKPKSGYIVEAQEFSIELLLAPKIQSQQIQQVMQAIWAFGLLGGLGARQRKGLGSVSISEFTDTEGELQAIPNTLDDYKKRVNDLFKTADHVTSLPPFTAFSGLAQCDVSQVGKSARALLQNVGEQFKNYRSKKNVSNKRLVFGLPNKVFATKDGKLRRSSPLFMHVHKVGNEYCFVQALLPAIFLPSAISSEFYENKKPAPPADWQVMRGYMENFAQRQSIYKGGAV